MRPLPRRRFHLVKFLAFFSQLRWYHLSLLLFGQYLAAVYVFGTGDHRWAALLVNRGAQLVIWSSAFILSFGFLINSFYDQERDQINRPKQTALERLVRRKTSLRIALVFLLIGLSMSAWVSWRAFVYMLLYGLGLWFYSHKLRKIPLLGHAAAAVLGLVPFFGLSVFYDFIHLHTLAFGLLLGLVLFSRELLKDLLYLKGDIIMGVNTVASEYGERKTHIALLINTTLGWIPAFFTHTWFSRPAQLGIVAILAVLTVSNIQIIRGSSLTQLRWAHLGYKVILILGILTIPFL